MRYRLNGFTPRAGSGDFDHLHADPDLAVPMRKSLEEMLQLRLSASELWGEAMDDEQESTPLADLRSELADGHPDAGWVSQIYEGLVRLSRWADVRLLACEYEPGAEGFLCIAATSSSVTRTVIPGDWVQAGMVALRDGNAEVRVSPRIFRPVCGNGSIVSVREGDAILAHEAGIGAAVDQCFNHVSFAEAVETLRRAARVGVPDPRPMLDEMGYLPRHRPAGVSESHLRRMVSYAMTRMFDRIRSRHEHQASQSPAAPSLWDVMNAITSVARELPDWRDRLDLEEAAGRLARLRPPVPRRTAGNAVALVGG